MAKFVDREYRALIKTFPEFVKFKIQLQVSTKALTRRQQLLLGNCELDVCIFIFHLMEI